MKKKTASDSRKMFRYILSTYIACTVIILSVQDLIFFKQIRGILLLLKYEIQDICKKHKMYS